MAIFFHNTQSQYNSSSCRRRRTHLSWNAYINMSESLTYSTGLAHKQLKILNFWMIIYLIHFKACYEHNMYVMSKMDHFRDKKLPILGTSIYFGNL